MMSKRILVVEDQADNRRILQDLLTRAGYEIILAENGQEALEVVARERPNLILMDIQLPLLDGYEANTSYQSRSGVARDSNHRDHVLCFERRREQGKSGWV